MIGLTYGINGGVPLSPAPVAETGAYGPDITHFYPLGFVNTPPNSMNSEEASAHTLGDVGTIFQLIYVTDPNDPLTSMIDGSSAYFGVQNETTSELLYWMYR